MRIPGATGKRTTGKPPTGSAQPLKRLNDKPKIRIDRAKQGFLTRLEKHGIDPKSMLVQHFLLKTPAAFWLWTASDAIALEIPAQTRRFLDQTPLSAFLKIVDAQTREDDINNRDLPPTQGFIIEKDTDLEIYTVVNRDYTGSMEHTFSILKSIGVEVEYFKNFTLPGNVTKGIPSYAISFVYPKSKDHASTPTNNQKYRDDSAAIERALSGYVSAQPESLKQVTQRYLSRTTAATLAGRSAMEIAQTLQWYIESSSSGSKCKVIYDNSRHNKANDFKGPRLVIYLNTSYVTESVRKIFGIIRDNGYDLRQIAIESQEEQGTRENHVLLTCTIKRLREKSAPEKHGGEITPADGSLLKEKIESLFLPILGTENLTDIVGPIMVGSSSSHTAGAARIGRYIRRFIEAAIAVGWLAPEHAYDLKIQMRNTFALDSTGGGHYSADAVVAGLMEEQKGEDGITEAKPELMHHAMELVAKQDKKITINGTTFSLAPGEEATENLQRPSIARHNPKKLNIASREDQKYFENQISVRIKLPGAKKEGTGQKEKAVFTITMDSVGGGLIRVARIRHNHMDGQLETSRLYSARANLGLDGKKACYFVSLKNGPSFDADGFIVFLKKKKIVLQRELLGDNLTKNRSLFFSPDRPLTETELVEIGKTYGTIAAIDPIGIAPKANIAMPFSDFKTLRQILDNGDPVGGKKCKTLADAAIAYQEAVFGIPEEETRTYYKNVLKVMFASVDGGINHPGALHPAFVCAAPCRQGKQPGPDKDEMSWSSKKMSDRNNKYPIESTDELFTLFTSVFLANKPAAASTFGVDRGAFTAKPAGQDTRQDQKNIDKWNQVFAEPLAHSVLLKYTELMFNRMSSGALGRHSGILIDFFRDLQFAWANDPFRDNIYTLAQTYALGVNEQSAKRGIMVAAPTAGSCGVIPGVLKAIDDSYKTKSQPIFSEKQIVDALLTASLVGLLFNDKLRTSGGTGGCQAEMGAAVAMAAAAATQLMGGDIDQIYNSVALGLKQVEGMTCTPIGGYVISPCIKRNGLSAQVALGASAMAMAGVKSFADPDSMMIALHDVAQSMSSRYKETGKGGIADSPCARAILKAIEEKA